MSHLRCTRRISFDAAHRVMEHESHCKYLHGHRYELEASFEADALDKLGRVIDFGVVHDRLGEWVNNNWDHNCILHTEDTALGDMVAKETKQEIFLFTV